MFCVKAETRWWWHGEIQAFNITVTEKPQSAIEIGCGRRILDFMNEIGIFGKLHETKPNGLIVFQYFILPEWGDILRILKGPITIHTNDGIVQYGFASNSDETIFAITGLETKKVFPKCSTKIHIERID